MRKKIVGLGLILMLVVALILPALPASADLPEQASPRAKEVTDEVLGEGEFRLSPNARGRTVRPYSMGELDKNDYDAQTWAAIATGDIIIVENELEIGSLPATMPDNQTLIPCQWRTGVDGNGVIYYQTDTNFYDATIRGTSVSVEYQGKTAYWNPDIYVGGNKMTVQGAPVIVDDPLTDDYIGNTIQWDYRVKVGNFLFVGGYYVDITRYVRQIEGVIQEFYIIEENPEYDIRIVSNYEGSSGFVYLTGIWASDATPQYLNITGDEHEKILSVEELSRPDVIYPIMIDDTSDFYTDSTSAELFNDDDVYVTARNAATGDVWTGTTSGIGQNYHAYLGYYIWRYTLLCNTAAIPDTANIIDANVKLYGYEKEVDINFYLVVQSSGGAAPHVPPVAADYEQSQYGAANGGQLYTSGFSTLGYNSITLTAGGEAWIDVTGWTRLMIRSSRDIGSNAPTGDEVISIRNYTYGINYAPKMTITYAEPVTAPTVTTIAADAIGETSARFIGYLTDDGGETCAVRFEYGLTGAYGSYTPWQSGFTSPSYFYQIQTGLERGQAYYYRAIVSNSHSTVVGGQQKFITLPAQPTSLVGVPAAGQVTLTWDKGDGAQNTFIRYDKVTYPLTRTDGDGTAYNGALSTTVHGGLDNGDTYYYSAWSEATEDGMTAYSYWYATAFATPQAAAVATTVTYAASDVTLSSAKLHGYLSDMGGAATVTVNFQYHEDGDPAWAIETPDIVLTEIGLYQQTIGSLDDDTLYHFRTHAHNVTGASNGNAMSFTTGAVSAPSLTTDDATAVTMESARLNGAVVNDGGEAVTAYFEFGLNQAYGSTSGTATGLTTGSTLYLNLEGLEPDTTYHFRFVGTNSGGTGYGLNNSFTTEAPDAPVVLTGSAQNVGATSASLNGVLVADGGVSTDVRFQWYEEGGSFDDNSTGWQTDKVAGDGFTEFVEDLDIGKTYFFRAQAQNVSGLVDGETSSFTTQFGAPTVFRATASSATVINLNWVRGGTLTYIVVNSSNYPATRADGEQVYYGVGDSHTHRGLDAGQTYYYRAWSWRAGDVFSTEYADALATTLAFGSVDIDTPEGLPAPEEPSSLFRDPDSTRLVNVPLYDQVNALADAYNIPRNTLWIGMLFGFAVVAGALTYIRTRSATITVVVVAIFIGGGTWVQIVPFWMCVLFMIGGLSVAYLERRA